VYLVCLGGCLGHMGLVVVAVLVVVLVLVAVLVVLVLVAVLVVLVLVVLDHLEQEMKLDGLQDVGCW